MTLIIVAIIVVVLISWIISVQRRLVAMDENINNAMSQIGVQLSSRFDALTALLDLTKGYAAHEATTLIETIKSRRSVITATSTPQDVLKQEGVISEALGRISMVAERYPELKANENYTKCMNAVDSYEKMVRTSRLIYNDSVTKLNREIPHVPRLPAGRPLRLPRQRLSGGRGGEGGHAQHEVTLQTVWENCYETCDHQTLCPAAGAGLRADPAGCPQGVRRQPSGRHPDQSRLTGRRLG